MVSPMEMKIRKMSDAEVIIRYSQIDSQKSVNAHDRSELEALEEDVLLNRNWTDSKIKKEFGLSQSELKSLKEDLDIE